MDACFTVGTILYVFSMLLSFLYLIGILMKNVGTTYFNLGMPFLCLTFPSLLYWIQWGLATEAPDAWLVSILFIAMNLGWLAIMYLTIFFCGTVIIGKNYIYRLGHSLRLHRYTFDQIKKCSGHWETDTVRRWGRSVTTKMYDIEVSFTDGTTVSFCANSPDTPKAQFFLQTVKAIQKGQYPHHLS